MATGKITGLTANDEIDQLVEFLLQRFDRTKIDFKRGANGEEDKTLVALKKAIENRCKDSVHHFQADLITFVYEMSDDNILKQVLKVLHGESVLDRDALGKMARRIDLATKLPTQVALAMEHYFDIEYEEATWEQPWYHMPSLETMESVCTNYGVISALLLSIAIGAVAAVPSFEWQDSFVPHVALPLCSDYGWLWARTHETAEQCADRLAFIFSTTFIIANSAAFCNLLVTVLMSCWVYIAMHATSVRVDREDEVRLLTGPFSKDFLILQLCFISSMLISIVGLVTLGIAKATHPVQVYVILFFSAGTLGIILFFIVWIVHFRIKPIQKRLLKLRHAEVSEHVNENLQKHKRETERLKNALHGWHGIHMPHFHLLTSTHLSTEKIEQVFDACDIDQTGKLDFDELQGALQGLGLKVSAHRAEALMSTYAKQQAGALFLSEFKSFLTDLRAQRSGFHMPHLTGFHIPHMPGTRRAHFSHHNTPSKSLIRGALRGRRGSITGGLLAKPRSAPVSTGNTPHTSNKNLHGGLRRSRSAYLPDAPSCPPSAQSNQASTKPSLRRSGTVNAKPGLRRSGTVAGWFLGERRPQSNTHEAVAAAIAAPAPAPAAVVGLEVEQRKPQRTSFDLSA